MADENDMRAKIMAIMRDDTLTDAEKAKKRQELLTSRWTAPVEDSDEEPGAPYHSTLSCNVLCRYCYVLCLFS
jgi:sulfatase maturation enzyme AslB (radical SAM superfamily)